MFHNKNFNHNMFNNIRFRLNCMAILLSTFLMISCGSDDNNDDDDQPTPEESNRYRGLWNSTTSLNRTFSDVAVSGTIDEVSTGNFRGEFFISGNFTPCCGEFNDGTVSFTIEEGKITSFTYFDSIPNCPGTFNGSGVVNTDGSLLIDITGTDCDGDHVGTISLSNL